MSHGPNVSMGGGSFNFDEENGRGRRPGGSGPEAGGPGDFGPGGPGDPGRSGGPAGPGGPGGGGWGGFGSGSGANRGGKPRKKLGCGPIVGIVVVLLVLAFLIQSCAGSSSSARNCGDYNLVDGKYVSAPDRGDYERKGDGYEYVGCNTSRSGGGGFFFLPFFFGGGGSGGSNYGDGSGFRGGGPGSGK